MAKYVESLSERDARLERENVRARERNAQTRESRAQEKEIKKQRRQALNRATSTSQRREIKKDAEDAIFAISDSSSAGGNQKGGIYDISTDNYSQPERNQTNQNSSIGETGIDTLGGSSDSDAVGDTNTFTLDVVKSDNTAGTATFNGSGVN
tara:strand:+ start:175 stop:630 length:456 start_codon:yes stop_codon:yes gene_type:complete